MVTTTLMNLSSIVVVVVLSYFTNPVCVPFRQWHWGTSIICHPTDQSHPSCNYSSHCDVDYSYHRSGCRNIETKACWASSIGDARRPSSCQSTPLPCSPSCSAAPTDPLSEMSALTSAKIRTGRIVSSYFQGTL